MDPYDGIHPPPRDGSPITEKGKIMKITREEIRHVADLARLDLEDDALDAFVAQIGNILDYVAILESVDTRGVEPMSHAISLKNAFRPDEAGRHLDNADALANAPEKDERSFLVPRVVG